MSTHFESMNPVHLNTYIIADSAEKRNSSKTGNSINIKPSNKIMSFQNEH